MATKKNSSLTKVRKKWSKIDGGKGPVEGSKYEERTEPKAEKKAECKAAIKAGLKFKRQHNLPGRSPRNG